MKEFVINIKIGIVGGGFVGNATRVNLSEVFLVKVFDTDQTKSDVSSLADLVRFSDIIFICVPTPIDADESCNTAIVCKVATDIIALNPAMLIVIKSSVPSGTTRSLGNKLNTNIAFNPEFLTEANAINDFKQHDIIIGVDSGQELLNTLREIYYQFIDFFELDIEIVEMMTKEAETVKYVSNTFLATKVIYANQVKQICEADSIDYSKVAAALKRDHRLGRTHWNVPGPDGKRGYGGSCFPKDVAAYTHYARKKGVEFSLLEEVSRINKNIR